MLRMGGTGRLASRASQLSDVGSRKSLNGKLFNAAPFMIIGPLNDETQ